jgi:hypothetical protein
MCLEHESLVNWWSDAVLLFPCLSLAYICYHFHLSQTILIFLWFWFIIVPLFMSLSIVSCLRCGLQLFLWQNNGVLCPGDLLSCVHHPTNHLLFFCQFHWSLFCSFENLPVITVAVLALTVPCWVPTTMKNCRLKERVSRCNLDRPTTLEAKFTGCFVASYYFIF